MRGNQAGAFFDSGPGGDQAPAFVSRVALALFTIANIICLPRVSISFVIFKGQHAGKAFYESVHLPLFFAI